MSKRMIPRSMKKFIRKEKARIRGSAINGPEQVEEIKKLYAPFSRNS